MPIHVLVIEYVFAVHGGESELFSAREGMLGKEKSTKKRNTIAQWRKEKA
jgi:hypothetical protein